MFNQPDTVVLINAHGMRFYLLNEGKSIDLNFPENILNHLEIIDQIGFEKLLDSFITANRLKSRKAIILLSENVVFEKDNPEDINNYFNQIPFKEEMIGKKIVNVDKNNTRIFAYNLMFYETFHKIVQKHNWQILRVVPTQAFPSLVGLADYSMQMLMELINNKTVLNRFNFLENEKSKIEDKKVKLLPIFFAVTVIGFLLVLFWLVNNKQAKNNKAVVSGTTPTPIPTEKFIDKKQYSISIFNGSGKDGEAGRLKEILETEGFTVDKIGNADNDDLKKTVIAAKANTNKDFLNELLKNLSKEYPTDNKIGLIDKEESDVTITIGLE